ncbi:Na+-transporting NADH:ubiquinone oxidoreductase subunit D [Paracoccus solventivorans]|jgi:Na+-transporting NADH:ubiquinone oxidoreductase subunit D|uniref:Na+-transporting NADH:ubiquinone oxidoreductase subunit D n=1 Tax=Paracoccus solventivorans TaxID=53463 RepID=A0A1M7EY42_9RHOB|nr:NADH:ubiquinone reductase (Na(+)-transporting) subunit D [Paracoccus solventivorans]MCO5156661.1 NADH:ubiquinone reductase (Na(+)-transporting) subunit D [Aquamicrobium sp.]SHL96735.1 Na+-transporting NADH:ubiquinone oxidoreductase subunit D [Paracoccus solventivorans]
MASNVSLWGTLTTPLIRQNPVTLQILGICSALAVTTSLDTALTMSISLTVVVVLAAGIISAIRRHIPNTIRIIVQIIIVASLVIVIDQVLQAYFYGLSQRLSVFVSLIATNCIVLGRTESFARTNPPLPSMVDALGSGLGYGLVLMLVGACRELFGSGKLLGYQVLPLADQGGWFTPLSLMLLAPSAFFLLGALVWTMRSIWPEQADEPDFAPHEIEEER